MKRLMHITYQVRDEVKREPPRHDRRILVRDDSRKPIERFDHAVSLRAVARLIIAGGSLGNANVVKGIEISNAPSLMIRPNGGLRQRHAAGKDLFNLLLCFGGEIGLSDQANDPMAFVEPGKSPLKRQQVERRKTSRGK